MYFLRNHFVWAILYLKINKIANQVNPLISFSSVSRLLSPCYCHFSFCGNCRRCYIQWMMQRRALKEQCCGRCPKERFCIDNLPSWNNGRLTQLTSPRHFITDGVYQKFVRSKSIIKQRGRNIRF